MEEEEEEVEEEEEEEVEEEETRQEHGKVEAERSCKRVVPRERVMSDRVTVVSIGVWRWREARRIGQGKAYA